MGDWSNIAAPSEANWSDIKPPEETGWSNVTSPEGHPVSTVEPSPGLVAKGRTYGPVVGEFHHDAMFGPNGNALGPKDVALSPDYQKYYPLGSNVMLNGQGPYRVADSSFVGPGQPNQATVELRDTANPPAQVEITPAPGEPQPDIQPQSEQAAPAPKPDVAPSDEPTLTPEQILGTQPEFIPNVTAMRQGQIKTASQVAPPDSEVGKFATFVDKYKDTPLVDIPPEAVKAAAYAISPNTSKNFDALANQFPTVTDAREGLAQSGAQSLTSLTTPQNLAILGGMALAPQAGVPEVAQAAISAGFGAQAAVGMAQELKQAAATFGQGGPEFYKHVGNVLLNGAMATAATVHAATKFTGRNKPPVQSRTQLLPQGPLKEVPPAFQGLPQIEEPNAPTNPGPAGAGAETSPSGTSPAQGQSNGPTAPNAGEATRAGTVGAPAEAAPQTDPIVAAAVKGSDGKIYTGPTHAQAEAKMPQGVKFVDDEGETAFVTKSGRVVDSETARQSAVKSGNISGGEIPDSKKLLTIWTRKPDVPVLAPAPELPLTEKIKRVIKESGAEEQPPGSLNFQQPSLNFKGGSAFGKYFKSWADRLKAIPKFADSVARFAKSKPIKDQITGTYDGIDNRAAYVAGQAASNVRLNLPTSARVADEAATFVRQADGDKAGMLAKLRAIKGRGYDHVIDYAERNWDKLQAAADAAKAQTDAVYDAEVAAGVDVAYRGGYVKGVYEDDLRWDLKNMALDAIRGRSGGSTTHLASKVFNDYAEAIQAGYKPRDLRLSVLTQSSVHNGLRLVNGRVWAESLGNFTMPDGKPVVVPMERIERKTSTGEDTYLLRPPNGYKSLQLSNGSLSAVHEDAFPLLEKLSTGSSFPVWASKSAASIKHNMLAFDFYHGVRFAIMQLAFEFRRLPSWHKGLTVLDYSNADLPRAVKSGAISQAEADWAKTKRPIVEGGLAAGLNAGKISDALYQKVAPILPGAKQSSNFIFGKLSRGIITQSYVYAFERNARLYPELTESQLHAYTAREVNTYYRNMGNQGLFQDKTAQDRARFWTFAPQWFEGKARSEGRGYGQVIKGAWNGNPARAGNIVKGMGTGIVSYLALNQIVNYLTRGHSTFENPEHGHKLDAWIPDFMQGTNGFFHSPIGVFAEITHSAMKAHERGIAALDIPFEIAKEQAAPIISAGRDIFLGKDFYGRPLHGYDRFAEAFHDLNPLPLFFKNRGYAGAAERNLFSTLGQKITPAGTSVTNIYKLADDFMAKNNIKVDHGNEPSKYRPLRQALQEGRSADAVAEYKSLLEQGPAYMPVRERVAKNKVLIAQAMQPDKFTPSSSIETHFRNSLTRDQLDIYNAAMKEKENVWQQFKTLPK